MHILLTLVKFFVIKQNKNHDFWCEYSSYVSQTYPLVPFPFSFDRLIRAARGSDDCLFQVLTRSLDAGAT